MPYAQGTSPRKFIWSAICAGLLMTFGHQVSAQVLTSADDAYVTREPMADVWSIGNSQIRLTVGLDGGRDYQVLQLANAVTGRVWSLTPAPDTQLTIGDVPQSFGASRQRFIFQGIDALTRGTGVELRVKFVWFPARLTVERHYAVYPNSPVVESWTTVVAAPGPARATLSNLSVWQFTIQPGTVRWLNGLQGDAAGVIHDDAFTLQQRELGIGEKLNLGARGRSSEQVVPWLTVDTGQDAFFGGLLWSGAWAVSIERFATMMGITLGLGETVTTVDASHPLDTPHGFFGVTSSGTAAVADGLRRFVQAGLRSGRPLQPLVTYNTWFAYGTGVDEDSMRQEMSFAAAIGTELFVMDAGWYRDADLKNPNDFVSGLGRWEADPTRFPSGLGALSDYAHSLNLKFGLWVEPERVALDAVDAPGLVSEAWLATANRSYQATDAAQLCLAGAAARQWLLTTLRRLIAEARPDYLKWDNNFWINCTRRGHGHGVADGNLAHVQGLYSVLETLRAENPKLLIENVSGGGNRLDLGMLRYSDVAWMDDRTAPSVHVRHNLEGLGTVFPPAYLLSFVTDHAGESLHNAQDLSLYMRSRTGGILGLCFRGATFTEPETTAIASEITLYKQVRAILGDASTALLTKQAMAASGPAWDATEDLSDSGAAVIRAFQSDLGVPAMRLLPVNLDRTAVYEVRSVDQGTLGKATGAELMANGIDLLTSPASAAHLIVLTRSDSASAASLRKPR